jgi:hypothetical protein
LIALSMFSLLLFMKSERPFLEFLEAVFVN